MHATAKDLRTRSRELLQAVARGEEVVVTWRGRPVARLVRATDTGQDPQSEGDPLFGIWRDDPASADVGAYVDRLRAGRSLP